MIPNYPIPAMLNETFNGTVSVLMLIMVAFAVIHVFTIWRGKVRAYGDRLGYWRVLRSMYQDNKPSIAFTVFLFALFLRFLLVFLLSDTTNHKLPHGFVETNAIPIYLVIHAILILGMTCWIRNVSPILIPNWVWGIVIAAAFGFGWTAANYSLDAIF